MSVEIIRVKHTRCHCIECDFIFELKNATLDNLFMRSSFQHTDLKWELPMSQLLPFIFRCRLLTNCGGMLFPDPFLSQCFDFNASTTCRRIDVQKIIVSVCVKLQAFEKLFSKKNCLRVFFSVLLRASL